MIQLRIREENWKALELALALTADAIDDLDRAGAWQAVSEVLSEDFERLFKREGATTRLPRWRGLAASTIRGRRAKNQTPIRIGWATGTMATSLIEPTHPKAVEIRRPKEYVRGTRVRSPLGHAYWRTFEAGRGKRSALGTRPGGRQPLRPIADRLLPSARSSTGRRITKAIEVALFRHIEDLKRKAP